MKENIELMVIREVLDPLELMQLKKYLWILALFLKMTM
jgi:hypothetical protein